MCVFYLVIGLAASVILTNLVNSAFMHIPLDLSPDPFVWISGVFANGQSIKLFGIFMILVLLLCVMYFFCSQKPYEADLITVIYYGHNVLRVVFTDRKRLIVIGKNEVKCSCYS